jgi:hypothetical protein
VHDAFRPSAWRSLDKFSFVDPFDEGEALKNGSFKLDERLFKLILRE